MSERTETNIKAHFYSFLTIVKDMRELQKSYFRTRNKEILIKSIETEKRVDRIIESWESERLKG